MEVNPTNQWPPNFQLEAASSSSIVVVAADENDKYRKTKRKRSKAIDVDNNSEQIVINNGNANVDNISSSSHDGNHSENKSESPINYCNNLVVGNSLASNIQQINKPEKPSKLEEKPPVILSEKSKEAIQQIVDKVKALSPVEQFLLYLKLPEEVSGNAVDPFRQHLNPLGSRSEIHRTICWIKTHLEEDPSTSLPKHEVYVEYNNFCAEIRIKPLSQADFGKVMKQVYPNVRARRLGTRGKSRYCYSGLRRCIKLNPPVLPDLSDKLVSTEAPCTQSSLSSAAWTIVRDWSTKMLGIDFDSLQALAYYLVLNHSIGTGSEAAEKIVASNLNNSEGEEVSKNGTVGTTNTKHREMQLQLQKKIKQKNENKERKRKLQAQKSDQKGCSPNNGVGGTSACKKSKIQEVCVKSEPIQTVAGCASNNINNESNSTSSCSSTNTSPTQGSNNFFNNNKFVCDKSREFTQVSVLPDFNNSFQPSKKLDSKKLTAADTSSPTTKAAANSVQKNNKVAIPRLNNYSNITESATSTATSILKKNKCGRNGKYKAIQPRLIMNQSTCDTVSYNLQPATVVLPVAAIPELPEQGTNPVVENNRSQNSEENFANNNNNNTLEATIVIDNRFKERKSIDNEGDNNCDSAAVGDNANVNDVDDDDFPLSRERLNSISNVEKDAMDEYLGTNSSQHDEELSKYFPNNTKEVATDSKLSTLRLLLQQKLNEYPASSTSSSVSSPATSTSIDETNKLQDKVNPNSINSAGPIINPLGCQQATMLAQMSLKRRVSFGAPTESDSQQMAANCTVMIGNAGAVPPSPNTRRKNFSFTPITDSPQSPINNNQSKCSSTTASPFVSPRNTPVLRSKMPNVANPRQIKKEIDFDNEINKIITSAPSSPMLERILSNRQPYKQEALFIDPAAINSSPANNNLNGILANVNNNSNNGPVNNYRSQSVPVNQMIANNYYPDGTNGYQIAPENVNTRSSLDSNMFSSNADNLNEFGFHYLENSNYPETFFNNQLVHGRSTNPIMRSQSIEIPPGAGSFLKMSFRSEPSTPLPFAYQQSHISLPNGPEDKLMNNSRSYPSTPLATTKDCYSFNGDCLLNGQPIRSDTSEGNKVNLNFCSTETIILNTDEHLMNADVHLVNPDVAILNAEENLLNADQSMLNTDANGLETDSYLNEFGATDDNTNLVEANELAAASCSASNNNNAAAFQMFTVVDNVDNNGSTIIDDILISSNSFSNNNIKN